MRDVLTGQRRVEVALPGVSLVERDVPLVAFAHLNGRGAFGGIGLTRDIAHTTDIELRILRYPAVQLAGRPIGIVLVGHRALLLDRQESGVARWWQVEVQVEVEAVRTTAVGIGSLAAALVALVGGRTEAAPHLAEAMDFWGDTLAAREIYSRAPTLATNRAS